ncbi:MAG: hypothetical protein WA190_06490 [Usitatibacter sp.]
MKYFAAILVLFSTAGLAQPAEFDVHQVKLPGEIPMTLDYFAWDSASARLWVPGGNTGNVFALQGASKELTVVTGFQTREVTRGTRRLRMGPSSATVGSAVVYAGNRADSNVCAIDTATLKIAGCVKLSIGAPDGIVYVATTKEVWITIHGKTLDILDVSDPRAPREKGTIPLGASPEGYAVDEKGGIFYTNLEDSAETVGIDVRTRKIVARWKPGCDGAHGLALDEARGFLLNACAGRVITIDANHSGNVVGSIETGAGLDNIDYSPSKHLLYAAAGKAATLTVASVDDSGRLSSVAVIPTANGARSVVAGDAGTAYVADPVNGRILVVTPR